VSSLKGLSKIFHFVSGLTSGANEYRRSAARFSAIPSDPSTEESGSQAHAEALLHPKSLAGVQSGRARRPSLHSLELELKTNQCLQYSAVLATFSGPGMIS
jgi:hypothetical protein